MKTDLQLQHDVLVELKNARPGLPRTIGVEVHAGIVTLSGTAQTDTQRQIAESAAQRVADVQAVDDEIALAQPGGRQRTDAEILRAVRGLLLWKTFSSDDRLKVGVLNGWVTLSGEVERRHQRQHVNEAIRALISVRGLTDLAVVQPREAPLVAASDVWAALLRRPEIDACDIAVRVEDGDVTLTGRVRSARERELARESAWCARGVRHVWDRLRVSP